MILEVRHLELVEAIHREGRITTAAEQLHMSQPAASHALGKLERRLGLRLFERHPQGMRVTTEGHRVLEAADRVLGELERTEQDLRLFSDGVRGVVRLSTQCYTGYHWVPEVLRRFRAEYPGVELRLQPDATYRVLEALEAGELDLAIMHDPPEADAPFAVELILTDEIVAIVSPDHPWADRDHVVPADFESVTVILHDDVEESTLHREVLAPAGVKPADAMELHLTEAVVGAAQAGLGVGVLASWAVSGEVRSGSVIPLQITREGLRRRWHAVLPAEQEERQPYMSFLIELLRDHVIGADRSEEDVRKDSVR